MKLSNTKIFIVLSILLVALFLRETPYLNILAANRVWIIFLFLFLFLFQPKEGKTILYISIFLLIITLILILLHVTNLAEFFGIIIYFLLWAAVIIKIFTLRNNE